MTSMIGILFSFLLAVSTEAGTVKTVKGKKVLLILDGESAEVGQVFTVKKNDKTIGLVKITKVKGDRALGLLERGKAEAGLNIQPRIKKVTKFVKPRDQISWGGMGGVGLTQAEIILPESTTISVDGMGFNLKALFDYPLFDSIWFRGLMGAEQFKVGGTTNAECGGECVAEITYIGIDVWGRWLISESKITPWIGAGGSLMFPISKTATAFNPNSITNNSFLAVGGGIDYYINATTYIPLQIEYDVYPNSSTVKASAISVRLGIAIPY